jgi:hypothetical protein
MNSMELKNPCVGSSRLSLNVYIAMIYATRKLLSIHQKDKENLEGLAAINFILTVKITSVGFL